jgi:hypothetical protein
MSHIILTQNFGKNADFEYIRYEFLILVLIFSTSKIARTRIILAQNF